jgi:putative salt-induced outer membrane protein YdiY
MGAACALLLSAAAFAVDRIELIDGSVINGKIISAEKGKFKIETTFAGTIEIKQDKIKTFTTDEAVNVGLAAGSTVLGKVESTDAGIAVVAKDGQLTAETGKVDAIWREGSKSPEERASDEALEKARRKWAFEASVAVAGRTGTSQKFGSDLGFKATLASERDKLIFTLAAENAKDNGVETSNRQYGSVDYSSFYSPDNGWYVRTSLEKDASKELDLRSATAFGFGRKLLKSKRQDLEFRFGINYLHETYTDNTNFGSPGLDLAVLHSYQFSNAKLVNSVSYTPAFKQFSNYRMHQESGLELPIGASLWKLKLGVANDYNSMPPAGTVRLDTTYFTSLLLNWK